MDSSNKKPLLILRDEDIFPDADSKSVEYGDPRVAVKAILLNDKKEIALVGTQNRLLPGGGVENGESLTGAMKRECLEECGYEVEILRELGTTEEYRAQKKRMQVTHCFVAKITGGDGVPRSTQEDEKNMEIEWFTLDGAIQRLKGQIESLTKENYSACFNARTHLAFVEEFKKSNSSQ